LGQSKFRTLLPKIGLAAAGAALLVIGGFAGYYLAHSSAMVTEDSLRSQIKSLEQQQSTATAPSTHTSINTSGTPACQTSDLTLARGDTQAAAGTTGITYSFTNKTASACSLKGAPTVTLSDATGKQLGQAATFSGLTRDTAIIVPAGAKAYDLVLFPNAANFTDADACSQGTAATITFVLSGQTGALQTAISGQHYCPGFAMQAFTLTKS
jgi:hypothetical protein